MPTVDNTGTFLMLATFLRFLVFNGNGSIVNRINMCTEVEENISLQHKSDTFSADLF